MKDTLLKSTPALKYDAEVLDDGRIELQIPFAPGSRITVFVIEEAREILDDLLSAAESSLDFWDNSYDDEDWNNA
ncbi:MAG: hypothetical protein ISS57_13725 [Anaerolineales bacterium]|nr:hypothetical protein [Anaerolineales bacterium]